MRDRAQDRWAKSQSLRYSGCETLAVYRSYVACCDLVQYAFGKDSDNQRAKFVKG